MLIDPKLTPIADDIFQLTLPLPFALNHVHCYLLRGDKGWSIVDTGINIQNNQSAWLDIFANNGIDMRDIEQIVLTHVHPDHFGMAGWLQGMGEMAGVHIPIYASEREEEMADIVWRQNYPDFNFGDWMITNGMPEAQGRDVAASMDNTRAMTMPYPNDLERISAGETIVMGNRTFEMIHTPGHADGHIVFYDADDQLMLSGDHILNKITPNIGLWSHSDPDPLGRYLGSLMDLLDYEVRLALPGHKTLIEDWRGRINELLGHHDARLAHIHDAITDGKRTPFAIAQVIFPAERFTAHEWRFAIAEVLAHLEYMKLKGEVVQKENQAIFDLA